MKTQSGPGRWPLLLLYLLWALPLAAAAASRQGLQDCRLPGLEQQALCGRLQRPLDPAAPAGRQIEVHYAVLPAPARNSRPDPVFFFAGGPGQSAMDLAGPVSRLLSRLGHRRDIVLIDQRGTGRSAALHCPAAKPAAPLASTIDPARQLQRWQDCRDDLQRLPHGALRHYGTSVAVQDADAVRLALGVAQINLVGVSYGTRVALELLRQFPGTVRRVVLDGVVPPDSALPVSASGDNQAALDAVFAACAAEADCRQRFPRLRQDWQSLLHSLPQAVDVAHPLTGERESLRLSRDAVLGLVRQPLYVPALAAALPQAIDAAARGRWEGLLGLSSALALGSRSRLAEGMHLSVLCTDDGPPLARAETPDGGSDFGRGFADLYRQVCATWPRGERPAGFEQLPMAPVAVLLLSGGADPVTPPRHGARVAHALGALASHRVVREAGHGVASLPCMRDAVFRFVDASTDEQALGVDTACAEGLPRPPAFVPPRAAAEAAR